MTTMITVNGDVHYISDEMRDRIATAYTTEINRCVRLVRGAAPGTDTNNWENDGQAALALRRTLFSPEPFDAAAAWEVELAARD